MKRVTTLLIFQLNALYFRIWNHKTKTKKEMLIEELYLSCTHNSKSCFNQGEVKQYSNADLILICYWFITYFLPHVISSWGIMETGRPLLDSGKWQVAVRSWSMMICCWRNHLPNQRSWQSHRNGLYSKRLKNI